MIVPAVVYLLALVVIFCGAAFSPDRTFKGYAAGISFLVLFLSGLVLAVNAL